MNVSETSRNVFFLLARLCCPLPASVYAEEDEQEGDGPKPSPHSLLSTHDPSIQPLQSLHISTRFCVSSLLGCQPLIPGTLELYFCFVRSLPQSSLCLVLTALTH